MDYRSLARQTLPGLRLDRTRRTPDQPAYRTEEIVLYLRAELGVAVLLVEQKAAAALESADRGYVSETGRIVFEGTAERLVAEREAWRCSESSTPWSWSPTSPISSPSSTSARRSPGALPSCSARPTRGRGLRRPAEPPIAMSGRKGSPE
jgi:hypothetical protein